MINIEEFYELYPQASERFNAFVETLIIKEREDDLSTLLDEFSPEDSIYFEDSNINLNRTYYIIYHDDEESDILSESGLSNSEDWQYQLEKSDFAHLSSFVNWDIFAEESSYDSIADYLGYTYLGNLNNYTIYEE